MPDRQRHGRLSDVFARLFAGRSGTSPAAAGRHRGAAPAGPAQADPAAGHRGAGRRPPEFWSDDPWAETAELSRPALEFALLQNREPDRPDPTADTMYLGRLTPPRPSGEPAGRDAGFDDAADDSGADFDDDNDDDNDDADDIEPVRSRSARSPLAQQRRCLAVSLAGAAAVAALLALPPVRAELRDSFTRTPQPYTALYFTSRPQVDGTVLTVPVSVHAVDTGTDAYSVRVWTVDGQGRIDDSRSADLAWDGQALSAVVSLPVNPAAEYVWVALDGSGETLHYKIAVA
ncbi:MAG: hypothetical protein ACJ786_36430 [Catenulispora sp.]